MNIEELKNKVRDGIVSYYGNPTMKKGKNQNGYSVYYARIGCLLCLEDRYILAVIKDDNPALGESRFLSQLKWVNFQSRILEEPPLSLRAQDMAYGVSDILNEKIQLDKKLEDRNIYNSVLPLRIELLYNEESKDFSSSGTLRTALETYTCSLTFTL